MYTSFSDEIWRAFRADNRPGAIQMLNLIRLRERAEYPDGRLAIGPQIAMHSGQASVSGPFAGGWQIAF